MKILKLLNKRNLLILFLIFLKLNAQAEDQPIDIWNVEKEIKIITKEENLDKENVGNSQISTESQIYKMQSQKSTDIIQLEGKAITKKIKIIGLYDPEDFGLDINMWSNSDGDQLKNIFSKLDKLNLSRDASEIMRISILTNAYSPERNILEKEFLKFKSDWLIKNSDLDLIEEYLIKNQIFDIHPELTKYLVDQYLADANIDKACEIFSKNLEPINNNYLSKFNIYCLIYNNKNEEAQLMLDLKKEMGFKDNYFEKKIDYLLGIKTKIDNTISQNTILDFHLAHITNPNFMFEPKNNTNKFIWKYLSSSNLLNNLKQIEISELDKISTIEKATHNKNYSEKDLFQIYKRFQFNINQLLNASETHKTLSNIEARALIYQKILLESEMIEKLKLLKILKNLFIKDKLEGAFDIVLKEYLEQINPTDIPDNLTSFYYTNIKIKTENIKNIKFNSDILHQSKLINYFNGDYSKSKIEKEVNNFLKKIKRNKKYFISKKDIIFLEALKSDGIKIEKKYDELYQINESEIPSDLQIMINNDEKGTAMLRIAEVIGQDELERIDEDTIYFIISTLNHLNINLIRNTILLKVLPLKV
jgi:hypothetical protein